MQFIDAVTVAATRRRKDGCFVAHTRIARTGVKTNIGSGIGKPDMSMVKL